MGISEKRSEERLRYTGDIIVNDSIFTTAVDISLGGMLIKTSTQLESGSTVSINIPAFDFDCRALVRFSNAEAGTGLKYEIENIVQWDRLAEILDNIKAVSGEGGVKPTLLVVDDNKAFRDTLRPRLLKAGYSVSEATDGMDAIKRMNSYPFHAMLVDLNIDRIDGFKLISLIRGAPDHKEKPIVVISSSFDPRTVERALKAGADVFLPKSRNLMDDLFNALDSLLGYDMTR